MASSMGPNNPRYSFHDKLQFEARCRAQLTVSSVLPEAKKNRRCILRQVQSKLNSIDGPPPPPQFYTYFSKNRVCVAQLVARDQAAARGVYCSPSDFSFRDEYPDKHVGDEFVTKFHRPSNQTQRLKMAVNQANFFENQEELTPGQKRAIRESQLKGWESKFQLQMPTTSSKWANTEKRITVARDQADLFGGPQTRDEWESYESTMKLIKPMPKTHSMDGKPFELMSAFERLAKTHNSRELQAAQVPLALVKIIPKRNVGGPPSDVRACVSVDHLSVHSQSV